MRVLNAKSAASRARNRWPVHFAWLHAWLAAVLLLTGLPSMADGNRWTPWADAIFSRITVADLRYANALAQDGQGLMWVGTQNGLKRWDGYRVRAYPADPNKPDALQDNFIQVLHTDAQGQLWVGSAAGGLARYDAERDAFVGVANAPGGSSSPNVWAIAGAADGGLWIGTGAGLDHVDAANGVRRHVTLGAGFGRGLAVKAITEAPDGDLWLGTDAGLLRRAPGSAAFVGVPLGAGLAAEPSIVHLLRDGAGRLWIGTDAHGAFVLEPGRSAPHRVHETAAASRLASESIRSIVEVAPGEVWLGTNGGGVVVFPAHDAGPTRRLRNHLALPTSLADDDISLIYRDRSGIIWVASTMALNVHDARDRGICTLFGAPTGDQTLTSPQIPAVLMAPDGRAWLSLGNGGGVDILDPLLGRVGHLRADAAHPRTALPKARVLAMASMPNGDVVIGTRQGLYRADAAGRAVVRVDVPERAADAAVWSLAFDAGVLWFGGGDGLWALDVTRARTPIVLRHEPADRIGGSLVTALLRGSGGTLWVGTSTGMARVDVNSGAVERLVSDATDPTALPGNYVAALLQDERGRLWVASFSAGIQVLERDDADGRPRFHRIGIREGLPHDGVDAMVADLQGKVWVSTDGGLAVIDPVSYAVRALGEPEGVAITRYWTHAAARTAAGELLFGGQGGLTVVRPERALAFVAGGQPLVATELRASGRSLVASRFNGAGKEAAPRIDVTAQDPNLSVEFSALDYTSPEFSRYSYRLAGFDRDWIETDAGHRVAAYTNLPPGDYSLQLRSARPHVPASPATLEIPVRVLPAWYQTAAFRFVAGFMGLVSVAGFVHVRTRVLQRRQRELQAQVNLRTAELQESQRQLELIAYADPLTGLDNRRRFNENLHQLIALSSRGAPGVALLLIDLDRFKQVNDSLGHDAGDALLIEMAQRLVATLRKSDRVARLGGDEFAVLLAATSDVVDVNASCQRIVDSLMLPCTYRGHAMQAGASIGAAMCPEHALDAEALYKRADLALYAAKNGGRNTWRLPAPLAETVD